MATANIKAVITAEDRASSVIGGFSKSSVAAFGAIAGIAQSVTTKAIDAVSQSITTAVKRVDTLNNSARVFANMGFKAENVKTSMDALKESILGLPTPLDQAVRGMQMIASTTPDINRAQGVFSALNNAIIGFGGSADMVENAVLQLSQAFSNGRIDAQTWNSMMQSGLGPTLNAIAKQMGITTGALKDGLSDGTYSVEQFQNSLIKLNKEGGGGLKSLETIAKDATAGISTGMENAKTALARGMAGIIEAIGAENISKAITQVGSFFEKTMKSMAGFIPAIKDGLSAAFTTLGQALSFLKPSLEALWSTITTKLFPSFQNFYEKIILPIVPVLGTVLVGAVWALVNALNAWYTVLAFIHNIMANSPILSAAVLGAVGAVILTTLVPAFIAWATAAGAAAIATIAATWPILLIGAAIGALAYLIVTHWETIKNAFGIAIGWIAERLNYLKNHFWEILGFIIGFFALLPIKLPMYVIQAIVAIISYLAKVNWGAVFGVIFNVWIGGWKLMINAVTAAFNYIKGLNWGAILTGVGKGIGNAVIGMIEGAINGAMSGIPGVGKIRLPRFAQGVQNFAGGLALVGERGPELVNLPRGSDVIPNNQLGGGQTTINVSINAQAFMGSASDARKFSMLVVDSLRDVAGSKNMTVTEMIGT